MASMKIGGDDMENSKTEMLCADCKHYKDDPLGMGFGHCKLKDELALAFDYLCDDGERRVDVAPVRHGRWKEHQGYCECDQCECLVTSCFKYCPNCGAKMDR